MRSVYIREQRPYGRRELQELLALTEECFQPFMDRLRAYGVVKPGAATRAEAGREGMMPGGEEDMPDMGFGGAGTEEVYVFRFVGIMQAGERILVCCPKYLEKEAPFQEMRQILKVLRRYQARRQGLSLYGPEGREGAFNRLGVMLYLVEDYLEHGVYTSRQPVTEINGCGEILWDQTINGTLALLVNHRPFYLELLTEGNDDDAHDFFRRLHQCIVTECSRNLEEAGLTELLELERLYESDEQLEELGEEDYLLYRLGREMGLQFDDRRSAILNLMDTYIAHRQMPDTRSGLFLFGTCYFEQVWEAVCAETMKNCLGKPLGFLMAQRGKESRAPGSFGPGAGVAVPDSRRSRIVSGEGTDPAAGYRYDPEQKLRDLIEKPRWRYRNSGDTVAAAGTLVPDLITVYDRRGRSCFAILDAKYYRIHLERGRVWNQPGIGDITKQYLYQLAYEDFIRDMGYDCVQNAFLFPGCGEETEYLGRAELAMLAGAGKSGLSHINAVRLPASRLYDAYLAGREEEPGTLLECVPEEECYGCNDQGAEAKEYAAHPQQGHQD